MSSLCSFYFWVLFIIPIIYLWYSLYDIYSFFVLALNPLLFIPKEVTKTKIYNKKAPFNSNIFATAYKMKVFLSHFFNNLKCVLKYKWLNLNMYRKWTIESYCVDFYILMYIIHKNCMPVSKHLVVFQSLHTQLKKKSNPPPSKKNPKNKTKELI